MAKPEAEPGRKRTQPRGEETRRTIMTAAAQLFATRGYRATGVRDIADAAGCNQALIGYHFGSKGKLYDEILGETIATAQAMAREADLGSSEFPERELVKVLTRALSSQSHVAPMIQREYLDIERLLNPGTANRLRGFMALTESVLAMLPLDDEARSWDPQIVHLAIVGPIIQFCIAMHYRETMADKLTNPMSIPSLETFSETLGTMLSRSLRGASD